MSKFELLSVLFVAADALEKRLDRCGGAWPFIAL